METAATEKQKKHTLSSRVRLSAVERRREVGRALAAGESKRSIAKRLQCDEGTIRRDARILSLPSEQIAKVEQGAAVEPFLRAQAEACQQRLLEEERQRAENFWRRRLHEERLDQRHSDPIARGMLDILSPHDAAHIDGKLIVTDLIRSSWKMGDLPCTLRLDAVVAEKAPQAGPYPEDLCDQLNYLSRWLLRYALALAPECTIRDHALLKVLKVVEKYGWASRPLPSTLPLVF